MTNPQPLGRLLVTGARCWGEDVVQGACDTSFIQNINNAAAISERWAGVPRFVISNARLFAAPATVFR